MLISLVITAISCSKNSKEDYGSLFPSYRQFLPMEAGMISYYQLDSTVVAPFGAALLNHSYFVKDSVGEATMTASDTTFPVYRYLVDSLQYRLKQQTWSYAYTYRIILKDKTAERIDEQNRRFIILTDPVKEGYSWDGNRYFSTEADINANDPYYGWAYTYHQGDTDMSLNATLTDGAITVEEADVTEGNQGPFDPGAYQRKKRAYEIYSRDGLVVREVSYITYQANANNPTSFGSYTDDSFGFKLTHLTAAP